MLKLQVVIVAYNKVELVIKAIDSINDSLFLHKKHITVIDNSDDFAASLHLKNRLKNMKNIDYFKNNQNLGFAKAVNQGLKLSIKRKYDYILLLNDDAFVDNKCIFYLIKALNKDKKALLAGPTIFYAKYPDKIWSAGGYINRILGNLHMPLKNKIAKNCTLSLMDPQYVDFLTGCVLMLKREAIEKVGFFDENLFFYAEDLEYCLRAKKMGYKLMYVPYALAWHDINVNKNRTNPFVLYNLARNNIIARKKHFNKSLFARYLLSHFYLYTPYRIYQVLKGSRNVNSIKAWVQGSIDGILATKEFSFKKNI